MTKIDKKIKKILKKILFLKYKSLQSAEINEKKRYLSKNKKLKYFLENIIKIRIQKTIIDDIK